MASLRSSTAPTTQSTSSDAPSPTTDYYKLLLPQQREIADEIIALISDSGGAGLFSEQGTGKTIIACAILEKIEWANVLIIPPKTAIDITWARRLLDGINFPAFKLRQTEKELLAPYEKTTRNIALVTPQLFSKKRIIDSLVRRPWDLIIFDESQLIKDRNSKVSRAAMRLSSQRRRLALSGTPADDSAIDIFSQMRFINPEVFGKAWSNKDATGFADQYCMRTGFKNKEWVFNDKLMEHFVERIKPYVFRLENDFLKLPPLVFVPQPVRMFGLQAEMYQDFEENRIIKESSFTVSGKMEITYNIKLEQMTGGAVLDDDGGVVSFGDSNAKLRRLKSLIERLESPLVVAYRFDHEGVMIYEALCDHFGEFAVGLLSGAVVDTPGSKQRTQLIDDFQAGRKEALCVQTRTGGVSVEYTRACNMIIYSFGYSYIDFEQLKARLHRFGQDRTVTIYVIYALDSRDEQVLDVIDFKTGEIKKIMKGLKR